MERHENPKPTCRRLREMVLIRSQYLISRSILFPFPSKSCTFSAFAVTIVTQLLKHKCSTVLCILLSTNKSANPSYATCVGEAARPTNRLYLTCQSWQGLYSIPKAFSLSSSRCVTIIRLPFPQSSRPSWLVSYHNITAILHVGAIQLISD